MPRSKLKFNERFSKIQNLFQIAEIVLDSAIVSRKSALLFRANQSRARYVNMKINLK